MIEGAVYVLNLEQVKLHGPTNFGWDKITLVERRVFSTLTWEPTHSGPNGADSTLKKVTRHKHEWVVFTHSDQGYATINEDEFEDELCYGRYELENWKDLHCEAA